MRWTCLFAGVVACAPTRPASIASRGGLDQKPTTPMEVRVALVPRPTIDMSPYTPEFHDELRWPLTSMRHPALEPQYAIADALAEPGVTWTDLCELGAQNRYGNLAELRTYLRGWCSAIKGDVDAACTNLVPLIGSTVPRLDDAVRIDLANILVNDGHADKAEHWLNTHKIKDEELLDLLAANYVEVGTTRDALVINQLAMDTDDRAPLATKCMRWTKHIVLTGDRDSALLREIWTVATVTTPDETCLRAYHKLECWIEQTACEPFLRDIGFGDEAVALVTAYRTWPLASADAGAWMMAAMEAAKSATLPGGADLTVAAIENAARRSVGPCARDLQALLQYLSPRLATPLKQRPDLQARLTPLKTLCGNP